MKLFDDFEIVKCPEENLLFVTHNGYLYYIYDPEYRHWKKHGNAGNDRITVGRYPDVTKEEIEAATGGVFPSKRTDFTRSLLPSELCLADMFGLLHEDYPDYMSDDSIYDSVDRFLSESNIRYKSYLRLKEIFDNALTLSHEQILTKIKELSYEIIGRDIFKEEIGIVDGHDASSYFWIMPVRVIDYSNTNSLDNVSEMRSAEISIEENDVDQYLTPFLYKYFDKELEANKKRGDISWADNYVSGFEWYLTHNFYTFEAVSDILNDIRDTINALSSGRETEYTAKLKEKRGTATYKLVFARNLTKEQIEEYNANRPTQDDTEAALLIDFYHRFIYRMEYMIRVGKEKGYNLISFMGP